MRKWLIGAGLLVLPAAASMMAVARHEQPASGSARSPAPVHDEPEAKRASARRLARLLATTRSAGPAIPDSLPTPAMTVDTEPPARSGEVPAEDPEQKMLRAERLQQRWESEAPDQDWTQTATESLGDMLKSAELEPSVVQAVSCRASVCRIEMAFRDFADVHKLLPVVKTSAMSLEVVPAPSAFRPASAAEPEASTEPRYLVYAARPGEHIASLVDSVDDEDAP